MLTSRSTSRETDSAIAGKYTVCEEFFGTEVPQDDSGNLFLLDRRQGSFAVGVRRWIVLERPVTARGKPDRSPHIFLNVPLIS
jgi:hypothetical protein